jgi:hypothetical protein
MLNVEKLGAPNRFLASLDRYVTSSFRAALSVKDRPILPIGYMDESTLQCFDLVVCQTGLEVHADHFGF